MKKLFGGREESEQSIREAVRKRKWGKAISHYERRLQEADRDFATWNRLGDLYWHSGTRPKATEAWRRAIEGFASEGLYENSLGVARKVLRLVPEEEGVHLFLADAYLGLEYHADCLGSLRSYLKLAKHPAEQDVRALVKRILGVSLRHRHLVGELKTIWAESGIEDFELQQRLDEYARAIEERTPDDTHKTAMFPEQPALAEDTAAQPAKARSSSDGLIGLEGLDSYPETDADMYGNTMPSGMGTVPGTSSPTGGIQVDVGPELSSGEGKDHYDLGVVYKEMKLWDAAVAEFEQARKDPSMRIRASLALAECLHEMDDLPAALDLLERERAAQSNDDDAQVALGFQIGNLHELLGNLREALSHFEAVRERNPSYGDVEERISELSDRLGSGETAS
ncbi:tetratricopeptide repeat protein [bacterium]|nr:tetratricopeptide repeat protein [bacterium]MBU1985396.1 tetratricopeptide repeat protein [bacterium]